MALTKVSRGLLSTSIVDNGNATAITIDSSENVGIGVTSPSSYYMDDLVVSAPNEGGITIASDSTSAGAYLAFADGTSGDTAYRGFVHYAHGSDYLRFGTAASERMRIDSSGNVLVGTTSNSVYNDASGTGIALNAGQIQIAGTGTPLYANRQGSDGDIIDFRKDGTTVGSIGNYGGLALDVGKGTTAVLRFRDSLNAIYPAAGVAGGTSDGVTSLGISSGRFKNLYLSGGVYLGGTGAANKLDDYETGNWTPSLRRNQGTTPASYNATGATYVKIGNIVHAKAFLHTISNGSANGTGYWVIYNMPFAASVEDYSGSALAYNSSPCDNAYVGDAGGNAIMCVGSAPFQGNWSGGFMLNITYRVN
jgi:hypothetical protein